MTAPMRTIYTDIDKTAILKDRHATWLGQARRHFAAGRRDAGIHALQMASYARGNLAAWLEKTRFCNVEIIDGPTFINSGGFDLKPASMASGGRVV